MSFKGVRQLKELVIRYSDIDGSSKGVREWIRLNIVPFAEKNPSLVIKTVKQRNHHPFVRGSYVNGNIKTICVKNEDPVVVEEQILHLRNQIGRRVSILFMKY